MVSIKEMFQIPSMERLEVIAGHGGLNRKISTVTVMDALDIHKWMKGGEFLITSGGPLKDNPEYLSSLLIKLDANGASAFGIKTERFLGTIPLDAIETANHLNFPLINIPDDFAFTDIINPVLGEIISSQARQLRFSEKTHQSFTNLALKEKPVEMILETLTSIIHRQVAFFDTQFLKIFVPSQTDLFYQELLHLNMETFDYTNLSAKYPTYEISNETTNYGILILGENGDISQENQNIALEHAGVILILDTQKRISNNQIASRFRDEFIHDIIYNNINSEIEFHNRATLYHWDFTNGGTIVIVDIDHFKQNYTEKISHKKNLNLEICMHTLFRSITQIVKTRFTQTAYNKLNDSIIFIIYEEQSLILFHQKLQTVFDEVRKEIEQKTGFTATVAVGRYHKNPMELHESFEEAKKCIHISHNLNHSNQMVFYDKLGIYKLINLVLDTNEATELLDKYIYSLRSYDKKNKSDFLPTFISICENSWNLKSTSTELFLHYNTVKYRYSRICKLLNTDFKCMDDRVNAEMAIRIYQMMK
ncbi:MAG: PucR family transcriptional regulator ligand-binding domain-containing protein [Lachnospiraceae bacterium]